MENQIKNKDIVGIDSSISLIKKYIVDVNTDDLISVLEALKADAKNEELLLSLRSALDDLGPYQGAVLNYAPYVIILLSNDILDNRELM